MKNVDVTFKWRLDRDSEQEQATITLDLTGLTEEEFAEYAYSDIIVQAQGKMRAWHKTDRSKEKPWKNGGIYVVKPKGTKVVADPEKIKADVMKALKKLSPEEIASLLESIG